MTKQRKINSTYAIVMVIGLAFMLLFGYLVKPFSTVTVVGYYTSRRKCIPVPQPSATQWKGADFYGQKRRNRPHLCP